jgi:histidine kinase
VTSILRLTGSFSVEKGSSFLLSLKSAIRKSLLLKLLVSVGVLLLCSLAIWGFFNFRYLQKKMLDNVTAGTQRLSNTIRLGTHYAMMLNSRDDIKQIITNISKQNDIVTIRIYNKSGEIKFSNRDEEIDTVTNIKNEACFICHRSDPPVERVTLAETVRTFRSKEGYRLMGVISPVYNEPGCSTDACHVHPSDKKVLGAIDLGGLVEGNMILNLPATRATLWRWPSLFFSPHRP